MDNEEKMINTKETRNVDINQNSPEILTNNTRIRNLDRLFILVLC